MISAKLPWTTTLSRNIHILQNKSQRIPFNHFKSRLQTNPSLSLNLQQQRRHLLISSRVSSQIESNPSTNIRSESNIAHEFRFFKTFKDGKIQFFEPTAPTVPPSNDPETGVQIKDISISGDVSARIFLPKLPPDTNIKLPVLFYVHGGGFCMLSPFTAQYTNYLKQLVAEANVIAISVDYGLFPDRPIPACYEDSWVALQWVASHSAKDGPDPWLNNHADFSRVFIAGDSAGGNISHTLAARVGSIGLGFNGVKVVGMVLAHPYFGGTEDDEMWLYMCPNNEGLMDRRLKPAAEDLGLLGCERVLVFVAEEDHLMGVGKEYVEELKKSRWRGTVEIVENKGRDHGFHLLDYRDEEAVEIQRRIISFIHQDYGFSS